MVDAGSESDDSMFGWVQSESGEDRRIGYQNCDSACTVVTYTVEQMTTHRDNGLETYSSSYPRSSARRPAVHTTQHQDLTATSDDDDDTDYTPIIIGASLGGAALIAIVAGFIYYRRQRKEYSGLFTSML